MKVCLQFRVTTLDVGVPEEAEQIVKLAESLAPLGGVFHLAMNLADKLITNQVCSLAIKSLLLQKEFQQCNICPKILYLSSLCEIASL